MFGIWERLAALQSDFFSAEAMIHAYLRMAEGQFVSYLHKETVWTKKYLYTLLALLACAWIDKYNEPPPVKFEFMYANLPFLPLLVDETTYVPKRYTHAECRTIALEIINLIEEKRAGNELKEGPRNEVLHDFIIKEMGYFRLKLEDKEYDKTPFAEGYKLNRLFRECILDSAGVL